MESLNKAAERIATNIAADIDDECDLCGANEVADVYVGTEHGDVFVCSHCLEVLKAEEAEEELY